MVKIVQPNVRRLSSPNFDLDEVLDFLLDEQVEWNRSRNASDGENSVEFAGRICYMSFGSRQSPRNNSEYIRNLIDSGHESVLEHVGWTFLITGVSRAFTHQLVRHRIGFSFSQLSQQYYDESEAGFVLPPTLKKNANLLKIWEDGAQASLDVYRSLLRNASESSVSMSNKEKLREARSAARSALPNSIEAKIVVTANARAIRSFFMARGAIIGDWEMRNVSCQIYKLVTKDCPALFQDFMLSGLDDGSESVVVRPLI